MSLKINGPIELIDSNGKRRIVAYHISIGELNPSIYDMEKPSHGSVELSCYPLCSYKDRKGKELPIYSLLPFEEENALGPGSHVIAVKEVDYDTIRNFSHELIPGALSSDRRVFQKGGMSLFRLEDDEFLKLRDVGMGASKKREEPSTKPQTVYVEDRISRNEVMKDLENKWNSRFGYKKSRFVRERPRLNSV